MKVHIARMSFISSAQKRLVKHEYEGTPVELAEKLLVDNTQYTPKNKKGFVGLIFGGFIFDTDGRLLSAKLGKSKEIMIPKYDDNKKDFLDKKDTFNPHVYFLWDRDEQVILLEKNTSIFQNYETVLRSIADHLNNQLAKYELRVFIEPLTEKTDFWRAINTYEYLYEVTFELHMPNLFGETQKDIKNILEIFRETYNATGVSDQISNPDGRLNIPINDPQVSTKLEWITKGGGLWSIKGKKVDGKRKVKITSTRSQNIKVEETIEIENYDMEEIKSLLSILRPKYSVKKTQEDDDENI